MHNIDVNSLFHYSYLKKGIYMTTRNLTKLTTKYTPRELTTAAKVLVDILALQASDSVTAIDPKEEFTPQQIRKLQKQLKEHPGNASQNLSLNEVVNALGL